jgi:hypothetical protein
MRRAAAVRTHYGSPGLPEARSARLRWYLAMVATWRTDTSVRPARRRTRLPDTPQSADTCAADARICGKLRRTLRQPSTADAAARPGHVRPIITGTAVSGKPGAAPCGRRRNRTLCPAARRYGLPGPATLPPTASCFAATWRPCRWGARRSSQPLQVRRIGHLRHRHQVSRSVQAQASRKRASAIVDMHRRAGVDRRG